MNWSVYDDSLVRRGRIFIDIIFLRSYKVEGVKRCGRPFNYSDSLIEFYATLKYLFHHPYRQLEGFNRFLFRYIDMPIPDYTTVHNRVQHIISRNHIYSS